MSQRRALMTNRIERCESFRIFLFISLLFTTCTDRWISGKTSAIAQQFNPKRFREVILDTLESQNALDMDAICWIQFYPSIGLLFVLMIKINE